MIPEFAPSASLLSPGSNLPAQPSSQTQRQSRQRAPFLMTQRPTPSTSIMVSREHHQQQQQHQQQLKEMAMAFCAQLHLQEHQQNLAQPQYLQQHFRTSAPSRQVTGLFGWPFRPFLSLIFRSSPH
ncbi:unnamed protein product [Mesocestoides corti]|uniref:Uncharacterized protein n=1 Tax=Mesocestoides corti TaxID=53468 RepID=A0A3P6HYT1_MESCO|nr:unnamed protein product [Mesocestoides corti]